MINYLGDLYRELHHIKKSDDEYGGYEPCLVILNHKRKGRSFMIPLSSIWKYVEPKNYKGDEKIKKTDWKDFNQIALKARMMAQGKWRKGNIIRTRPDPDDIKEGCDNLDACIFAYLFHKGTGIYLCTGYNLAKCLQMFEIELKPQAAAQLLLWIQDRLDDLRNMPESPEEEKYVAGEAEVFVGGDKIATKEMTVTDTDLVLEDNAT